ncbi:GABRR [Lepeophtheirus salmonis]|uniref:GABRR n=1 Tax=Lepeophtheirus salmonis TaxID=72036 RepID=A0A7R8H6K1_LEPSM|nr:GABRR [Lepeophtheirus salmonis]CAF2903103.1 GABRR [Lepeophtheirus salmonis]
MTSSDVVITYHDDWSKKKECGSFSVQGITINGKYCDFPTLPVSSETRNNLTQLRLPVLNILSIVIDGKYTPKDIQEKIILKLTDRVSHNFGMEEMVALGLGTDHMPDHFLCHTHTVLMFNLDEMNKFHSLVCKDGELLLIWKRGNDSQQKSEEMGLSVKEAPNKDLDRKGNVDIYYKAN